MTATTQGKKAPNVLYVFADQWRRQAAGFMGQDAVITPHMDAFAAESLVFDNAVTVNPLCSPHRASLMTGKYSTSHGVFTNCKPGLPVGMREEETCWSDVLKARGYQTAYIGKWHLDEAEVNRDPSPASGASGWDAYTPPGRKRHGFEDWYSYGTFDDHLHPHYWRDTPAMLRHEGWSPAHETDESIRWLKRRDAGKPFALALSWNPPHSPYELVPEEYRRLYRDAAFTPRPNVSLANGCLHTYLSREMLPFTEQTYRQTALDYFAAISGLDAQFGRLIAYLKDAGVYDDTIIVLTADHGDMMGSHGLLAKHVWYEESVGVPFVIRYGDRLRTGVEHAVLNTPDIMPTLLDLAGAPIPGSVEGRSFAGCMAGSEPPPALCALLQGMPGSVKDVTECRARGIDPRAMGWRALRTERYAYVEERGFTPGQATRRLLYDLASDPYQQAPLALPKQGGGAVAEECKGRMDALMTRIGDPFRE